MECLCAITNYKGINQACISRQQHGLEALLALLPDGIFSPLVCTALRDFKLATNVHCDGLFFITQAGEPPRYNVQAPMSSNAKEPGCDGADSDWEME